MKQETKVKILSKANKFYNKAVSSGVALASTVGVTSISASAEGEAGSGQLSAALSSVDPNLVLNGFYEVLPTVLTIAMPIIGAKVALHFLFGSVKGV